MPMGTLSAPPRPVIVMARSDNRKLGGCAATYVAQGSCPRTCPFRGAGCYAEQDWPLNLITARLNAAPPAPPDELARIEARMIDALWGDRGMRLHVVGDTRPRRA